MAEQDEAARPSQVDEGPRDLRRERAAKMRLCTPKQRKWLRALASNNFQKWKTAEKLGYSNHSVFKWLRMDHVRDAMALLEEIADADSDLTRQRVIAAYESIAFADVRDLYEADGRLKAPNEWPDDVAAAVQSVETQERKIFEDGKPTGEYELVRKVRRHDKRFALDFLATRMKIAGARRFEVTGRDGEPLPGAVPIIQFVERADSD
jgi:phage terminase small subunit